MTKKYELTSGKQVKVTAKNKRVAKTFNKVPGFTHYAYTILIEAGNMVMKTVYHDSANNYQRGIGASQEMINTAVQCAIMDADSYLNDKDYRDFICSYGYEDGEPGRRVYEACKKTYEALYAMLSETEVDDLFEQANGSNS